MSYWADIDEAIRKALPEGFTAHHQYPVNLMKHVITITGRNPAGVLKYVELWLMDTIKAVEVAPAVIAEAVAAIRK